MISLSSLFGRRAVDDAVHALYTTAVEQARREEFYVALGVPDNLDGRFDLLALHVFLLLNRLGRDGRAARPLGQALFDLMFADMDRNLREMGVSDMAVGGRVKSMAKAFYGRIAAYEPGLTDRTRLTEALTRNLYRGAPPGPAQLAAMADYVIAQAELLAGQALKELEAGRVRFGAPAVP